MRDCCGVVNTPACFGCGEMAYFCYIVLKRSGRGSVIKVMDLHPASLGSTPTGTHISQWWQQKGIREADKVKVHTLDIAPLRSESPPQKCSGMAHVLEGFHSFTCTPTCSSATGMSHTCLCLPSRSWYSFTDPGEMEG